MHVDGPVLAQALTIVAIVLGFLLSQRRDKMHLKALREEIKITALRQDEKLDQKVDELKSGQAQETAKVTTRAETVAAALLRSQLNLMQRGRPRSQRQEIVESRENVATGRESVATDRENVVGERETDQEDA